MVIGERGGSFSTIDKNISFSDLVDIILKDFTIESGANSVKISYALPSTLVSITKGFNVY